MVKSPKSPEGVKKSYWDKLKFKKENKRRRILRQMSLSRDPSERNDSFNIGNASEIGKRTGENTYQPSGSDLEMQFAKPVSFLRKSGNVSADIHMKIIL